MGRSPCYDKMGMKKGQWTSEEDEKLLAYIQQHGHQSWRTLPSKAGLQRCGKSCRLRWINYLRPDIKRGKFSLQEEQTIIQLHALLGNRWSTIATHLPKRTDNEIKNYWNTHLKKKLTKMGIDPITHKPKNHALGCEQTKDFANLCHMAQWESARLEAEARLVRESKLMSNHYPLQNPATVAAVAGASPLPPCLDILQVWVRTNAGRDVLDGFSTSNGSIEPQTFASNLSHNVNYVEMSKMSSTERPCLGYYHDGVKGITENPTHAANSSLGFPNLVDGFDNLPPSNVPDVVEACWNVLEDDNINYWGNLM